MRHVLMRLMIVAAGWAASIALAAAPVCDTEGAFAAMGLSGHKQCVSGLFPEFIDYQNAFAECRLIIFLTDLSKRKSIEELLRPGYRQYAQRLPKGVCAPKGEPILEFRRGKYSYSQMSAWQAAAEAKLRDIEPERITNVMFMDLKLWIFVAADATMERVRDVMLKIGVPADAYNLSSRETEIREAPSIAPAIRVGVLGEEILLPVHLWSREKVGELILGRTTLEESTRAFPPWPGHGPSEQKPAPRDSRSDWISDEINDAIDTMRYNYNPGRTFLYAGFNRNKVLIMVQYEVQEGQGSSLIDALTEMATMEETYREEEFLVLRGQIGSCIAVDTGLIIQDDGQLKPAQVTYVYTCDRRRKR